MTKPPAPERGSRTRRKLALYRLGLTLLGMTFRVGPLASILARTSKVFLRHARIRTFLARFAFDGIVDGGANVGEFAHLVRDTLPDADLVCVEPHPPSASLLRKKGFRVVEAALWNRAETLRLTQPGDATTSCTVIPGDGKALGAWEVTAMRLDELQVAGSNVLVKLDLQGAEPQALCGMDRLWDRCRALLLEVSLGPNGDYESLRADLTRRGFREYATLNEFEVDGRVVEADKVWVRSEPGAA